MNDASSANAVASYAILNMKKERQEMIIGRGCLVSILLVCVALAGFADSALAGVADVRVVANWDNRVRGYEATPPSDEVNSYYSGTQGAGTTGSDIAVGDFNGDGDLDYASVINSRIRIYDGSSNGENEFWYSSVISSWGGIVAGDFNNDNVADIAAYGDTRIRVWSPSTQGVGSGAYWYSGTPNTLSGGQSLSAADFDGDGNLEIAGITNNRVRVWEPATTTSGESADAVWYSQPINADTGGGITVGRFRDVGLVGGQDSLQVAVSANGRIMVFEPHTGLGSAPVYYSPANYGVIDSLATIETDALNPGQWSGDGDQIAFAYGNRVKIYDPYFPEPNGTHGSEYWYSSVFGETPTDVAVYDFDGDGKMELVAPADGRIRIWEPHTQGSGSGEYFYTEATPAGTATSLDVIPEPATMSLMALAAAGLLRRRRS